MAGELAARVCHRFRTELSAGDLLRLTVEQREVDVAVSLAGPDGSVLTTVDRPTGGSGRELLLWVAERAGEHRVEIRAPAGEAGSYVLQVAVRRPATEAEREVAAAYRQALASVASAPEDRVREWTRAAAVFERHGEHRLAGESWHHVSMARQRDDPAAAAEAARRAAEHLAQADEAGWHVLELTNACVFELSGSGPRSSLAACERAAALADHAGPATRAGIAHTSGLALRMLGELQPALDRLEQALSLWSPNASQRPVTLHELGVLHARYLGDADSGRELLQSAYESALAAEPPDQDLARTALSQLGRIEYEGGRLAEARRHLEESIALSGRTCQSAVTLLRLALVEQRQGEEVAAARHAVDAARVIDAGQCPRYEGTAHLLAAELAEHQTDWPRALDRCHRAETYYQPLADRSGLAESLECAARALQALDEPSAALAASSRSLELVESVRPTVLRDDLRTAYFASVQASYDLHIELLVELDRNAEAWAAAERARAQGLRDLLLEAGVGLRGSADPALLRRERELRQRLNELESRRVDRESEPSAAELAKLRNGIGQTVEELETVRGELRRGNDEYAELIRPRPPPPSDLQALLDAETTLLEYRLGEQASTLWAVSRQAVRAYPLPPRHEIERLALQARAWMKQALTAGPPSHAACRLADTLLGPAADELAPRLIVVADGELETVSFAALPDPRYSGDCAEAPLLIETHRISYLPSASVLAAERRRRARRAPAERWLAVVADPVYGPGDPRFRPTVQTVAAQPAAQPTTRPAWPRLEQAGEEMRAVIDRLPPEKVTSKVGFDATREAVTGGALKGHRIVHFATHGLLDREQPLLSRLLLSQLDARGRPLDGTLSAHEIYDLELPAELVVLSACETGLGTPQRGEGFNAGLPRAFLYAGAARVLVTLWPVPDGATSELMESFYRGLVELRLAPAEALRRAQLAAHRSGAAPGAWAGFLLVGETAALPPFE